MRSLAVIATLLATALAAPSLSRPRQSDNEFTRAQPGGISDIVITEENTLNGTAREDGEIRVANARDPIPGNLPLNLVNNFGGGPLNAYIQGLDSDGFNVFLAADGSLIYPSSGGSEVPVPITENIAIPVPSQGETLSVTLPIALSSGRVYFCEGELEFFMVSIGEGRDGLVQPSISNLQDPSSGLNWGFVELTLTTEGVIWANISFVDFVGLPFGMRLHSRDGGVQEVLGLPEGAVGSICEALRAQGDADGRPWAGHCIAGTNGPLRVVSPNIYAEINPQGFEDYWNQYIDEVWDHYSRESLRFNLQNEIGEVTCGIVDDQLECEGDNRPYPKPNAVDIWSCDSGPFSVQGGDNGVHVAVVPRFCAAFVRSVLLLEGGDLQPSLDDSHYYTVDPTHHYSRIVHENEVDGRGYAFPYDDVVPDGSEDAAGLVADGNPDNLTFYIGGVGVGV